MPFYLGLEIIRKDLPDKAFTFRSDFLAFEVMQPFEPLYFLWFDVVPKKSELYYSTTLICYWQGATACLEGFWIIFMNEEINLYFDPLYGVFFLVEHKKRIFLRILTYLFFIQWHLIVTTSVKLQNNTICRASYIPDAFCFLNMINHRLLLRLMCI